MKNKREDRFEAIVDQFVKNDLIAQEEYSYYLYGVKHLEVLIMTTGGVLLSGILLKEILFTVVFLITFSLLRIGWQISLNTVDYQRVEVTQDGKGFYYIGDEGKSLYCYHIDSKENEKIVQAEEVGAEKVTVEGVSEEGILFRAFPENELYVKNEEGISNLKLSDRLPTDQAWLSGINDITKDGVYFTYQEKYIGEKEIEGDLLMYDAYIEKEDLFGKTGEMKVIYTPRVSSAGNIVTEE